MRIIKAFPRIHVAVATCVGALMCSAMVMLPDGTSMERTTWSLDPVRTELVEKLAQGDPNGMPVPTPAAAATGDPASQATTGPAASPQGPPAPSDPAPTPATPQPRPEERWTSVTVRNNDSLAAIFKRQGLTPRQLHDLQHSNDIGAKLRRIYPGHTLSFLTSPSGELLGLRYAPGPLQTWEFRRTNDGYDAEIVEREPDAVVHYASATIDHSLFIASQRAGLSDNVTMRLASIFQWDIDFVLDIRKGDQFSLIYEQHYIEGKKVDDGPILAAEFINQGRTFRAVNFTDSQGVTSFYTPEGRSMRKAFLRAPLEFTRISSNFNLRRVHPLFKRVMPHRGIDYAAPRGTPIVAAGDGTVQAASRHKANGNYVVLRHGEQYSTRYLHMARFARGIRTGSRVRQGQVIGYVGSTGWATGPHLHYEFLVHGTHRNPRTAKLPKADPVLRADRQRFDQQAAGLLAQLAEQQTEYLVQTANGQRSSGGE